MSVTNQGAKTVKGAQPHGGVVEDPPLPPREPSGSSAGWSDESLVVYEPNRPRYILQLRSKVWKDWKDIEGYADIERAQVEADSLMALYPTGFVRVIDTGGSTR